MAFQQSLSMLHVPIDVHIESALDADVKSWLPFAAQKTDELVVLARPKAGTRSPLVSMTFTRPGSQKWPRL